MKLVEILHEEDIIPTLKAKKKESVLKEICSFVETNHSDISNEELYQILLEREHLGSTGIGEGVAIPHGKLKGIKNLIACLARSKAGIPFDALDDNKVKLFFILIAPEGSAGYHLKALARVARLMHNSVFRKDLLDAKDAKEMFSVITREDNRL